jgi:hypothetical protein
VKIERAEMLARDLIGHHLPDYRFQWEMKKGRVGACSKVLKVVRLNIYSVITMPEEHVLETLLHEIAHGLSPVLGHKPQWAMICASIGGQPDNYYRKEQ